MFADQLFALPTTPLGSGPVVFVHRPMPPFDVCLDHLPVRYGASVRAYVEEGLLPGLYAGGQLWTVRSELELWLNDIGHSSGDPADPAYIACWAAPAGADRPED